MPERRRATGQPASSDLTALAAGPHQEKLVAPGPVDGVGALHVSYELELI
jgi:hypothetical protein